MRTHAVLKFAAACALAAGVGHGHATSYQVQYLANSGGGGSDMNGSGAVVGSPWMNDAREVVGDHAALWLPMPGATRVADSNPLQGTAAPTSGWPFNLAGQPPTVPFQLPPEIVAQLWAHARTGATAINNSGAIIGAVGEDDGHPYLLQNGSVTMLPVPVGLKSAIAVDINDAGVVVGYGWDASGMQTGERHVLRWQNGEVTDLSVLPDGSLQSASVEAINASGVIAGWAGRLGYGAHAAVWIDGVMSYLPDQHPSVLWSMAWDVNDLGQVVGNVQTDAGNVAAIWRDGELEILDLQLGDVGSRAHSINNKGQVLIDVFSYWINKTYMRDQDGTLYDLSELTGLPLIGTSAINDAGQILAMTTSGEHVLLTPVPEPGMLSLMFGGLLFTGWAARARASR